MVDGDDSESSAAMRVGSSPTTPILYARMLELVDGDDSKSSAVMRVGSSPTLGIPLMV